MMPSPINIATATRMEGAGSHRASTHPSRSFQPRRLLAVFGEAEPAEPPPRLRCSPPPPPRLGCQLRFWEAPGGHPDPRSPPCPDREGTGEPVPVLNSKAGSFSPSPRSLCSIM